MVIKDCRECLYCKFTHKREKLKCIKSHWVNREGDIKQLTLNENDTTMIRWREVFQEANNCPDFFSMEE